MKMNKNEYKAPITEVLCFDGEPIMDFPIGGPSSPSGDGQLSKKHDDVTIGNPINIWENSSNNFDEE